MLADTRLYPSLFLLFLNSLLATFLIMRNQLIDQETVASIDCKKKGLAGEPQAKLSLEMKFQL